MTSKTKGIADRVVDATIEILCYLKDRWQDEGAYENWADYVQKMKDTVDGIEGVEFISMSKRPFGFKWKGDDGHTRLTKIARNSVMTLRLGTA